MPVLTPCMGGWCRKRDECAHHVADAWRARPAERLCAPGLDEPMPIKPQPVQWWQREREDATQ